jgi:hypothetical protein
MPTIGFPKVEMCLKVGIIIHQNLFCRLEDPFFQPFWLQHGEDMKIIPLLST